MALSQSPSYLPGPGGLDAVPDEEEHLSRPLESDTHSRHANQITARTLQHNAGPRPLAPRPTSSPKRQLLEGSRKGVGKNPSRQCDLCAAAVWQPCRNAAARPHSAGPGPACGAATTRCPLPQVLSQGSDLPQARGLLRAPPSPRCCHRGATSPKRAASGAASGAASLEQPGYSAFRQLAPFRI